MSGHSVAVVTARHGGNPILRAIGWISQLCGWVAAAMISASVLITCQMIVVRGILGQSTVWQTEAVIYLMVAATMIGLPYVQYLRGHVNVDLVPLLLPRPLRLVLAFVTLGLGIAVIAMMAWYGFDYWHFAWERNWKSETVWAVRLWIPYFALPLGFGLFVLQLGADMAALLLGIDTPFGTEPEEH